MGGDAHRNEFDLTSIELDNFEKPKSVEYKVVPVDKKEPVRKPLPENLPRTVIVHDLPEDEKVCAQGHPMEDTSTYLLTF